ncbi:hypothetical protein EDB89DRAFT_1901096 [Lactarius sanguifluus]|nr:hypothetical protein EDB89DRAFT_1901096 [Lactarius sanguifluus]
MGSQSQKSGASRMSLRGSQTTPPGVPAWPGLDNASFRHGLAPSILNLDNVGQSQRSRRVTRVTQGTQALYWEGVQFGYQQGCPHCGGDCRFIAPPEGDDLCVDMRDVGDRLYLRKGIPEQHPTNEPCPVISRFYNASSVAGQTAQHPRRGATRPATTLEGVCLESIFGTPRVNRDRPYIDDDDAAAGDPGDDAPTATLTRLLRGMKHVRP